jgi:hypothetical protein
MSPEIRRISLQLHLFRKIIIAASHPAANLDRRYLMQTVQVAIRLGESDVRGMQRSV